MCLYIEELNQHDGWVLVPRCSIETNTSQQYRHFICVTSLLKVTLKSAVWFQFISPFPRLLSVCFGLCLDAAQHRSLCSHPFFCKRRVMQPAHLS